MKYFSSIILICIFICSAAGLFAAPLEGGFALAPRASFSQEERIQAYINARLRVIEAAGKYEDVPYRHGGITSAGLDCSGFVVLSFRDALGVTLPRTTTGLYTWTERVPLENAQPGDLLFFRTGTNRNITHVAIYLGNRRFIHSASAGAKTGVIYSSLDEQYWAGTFAGAGRAFPEVTPFSIESHIVLSNVNNPVEQNNSDRSSGSVTRTIDTNQNNNGFLFAGIALAPTWNGFISGGDLFRGVTSQFTLLADTSFLGPRMVFGFEVRPEYDGALGVFRLPITFSWGPSERIRIFAGPVLSFGDASLSTDDGVRNYSGGTSWLGSAGVTAAPFGFKTPNGEFAPYFELAWQSYFSDDRDFDLFADFSAGLRFSTGLRWLFQVR